jgi:hypothetical protein
MEKILVIWSVELVQGGVVWIGDEAAVGARDARGIF